MKTPENGPLIPTSSSFRRVRENFLKEESDVSSDLIQRGKGQSIDPEELLKQIRQVREVYQDALGGGNFKSRGRGRYSRHR